MKLQPDAEHQQDDADFRELLRQRVIGDKAWRVGTDQDACGKVADDGRKAEPLGDRAADERRDQTTGQGENEIEVAVHGPSFHDRMNRASASAEP
jgi:hypothetical protein